jgi:hypothetical protein
LSDFGVPPDVVVTVHGRFNSDGEFFEVSEGVPVVVLVFENGAAVDLVDRCMNRDGKV